jgi:carbonic anhydrase
MTRKSIIRKVALSLAAVSAGVGLALASAGAPSISPDDALQKLMEGNKRFVANQSISPKLSDPATRKSLAQAQKPYAIILACSDSRVPPEIVFDKGLGEIFIIRVAGNVPDPITLGSIEFAAANFGSPLVMVLGHERCGAVQATVDSKGKSSGSPNIDAIVKAVSPAVKKAATECEACKGVTKCADSKHDEFVECAIDTNAKLVAASLTKNSKILKNLVAEKKVKIVAAKYDLDDGTVTLIK